MGPCFRYLIQCLSGSAQERGELPVSALDHGDAGVVVAHEQDDLAVGDNVRAYVVAVVGDLDHRVPRDKETGGELL